ncbi:MAG: sigma-70 family RNA polymerase sigma factor [Thermoguttaceae bacterium]
MSLRSPSAPTNEELACRAQQGCVASFEQLLRRFQTPVLHFLRRRGHAAEAEDIAQDTFLRAYENLHRYDPQWRFSTWLFTIARRTSLNAQRRKRPTTDPAAVDAAVSSDRSPLDVLVRSESRRRIWDIAAQLLSEEQWTVLWLHYVENMPLQEVARVVNRSRPSVKVAMFRARRKLAARLEEWKQSPSPSVACEASDE